MLLEVENATKSFGGLTAIHNVSFRVEKGSIMAIIGPNGAGKSTLFDLVSGFQPVSSGRILLNGENITGMPIHNIVKRGMSRTFQTTHLFSTDTVLDNVIVGHALRTKAGLFDAVLRTGRERRALRECRERAMEALTFVGVDGLADRQVGSISQEAQKRVAIALALATNPQLVLLDEIAGGVNADETDGLVKLISKMVRHGLTVCFIEHKMNMVMNLADRIMVLHHGNKIAEGTPEEVRNNEAVVEAYLGGVAFA